MAYARHARLRAGRHRDGAAARPPPLVGDVPDAARGDDAPRRRRPRLDARGLDAKYKRGLDSSRVPVAGAIAVGYRLLTAPFCMGFAGIEAFCAFLAVATHRICQPRQESLFERNAAG